MIFYRPPEYDFSTIVHIQCVCMKIHTHTHMYVYRNIEPVQTKLQRSSIAGQGYKTLNELFKIYVYASNILLNTNVLLRSLILYIIQLKMPDKYTTHSYNVHMCTLNNLIIYVYVQCCIIVKYNVKMMTFLIYMWFYAYDDCIKLFVL